jgi:hypothetical protein
MGKILSFKKVVCGPLIFDLCYYGTSLQVSAFPDLGKKKILLGLFRGLIKSYQETFPLTSAEMSTL